MQWGVKEDVANNATITLPISFSGTSIGISLCSDIGSGNICVSSNVSSKNTVKTYMYNPGNSTSVTVVAIGK